MAKNKDRIREQQAAAARAARLTNLKIYAVIGLLIAAGLGAALWSSGAFDAPVGEKMPHLGNRHIPEGETVAYGHLPPTSGNHWGNTAPWNYYDFEQPDERLVHNLEHGGIIISYNKVSPETVQRIKALRLAYVTLGKHKIITRPYAKIPEGTIAITGWGWRDTMTSFDEARLRAFIDAHYGKAPEGNMP